MVLGSVAALAAGLALLVAGSEAAVRGAVGISASLRMRRFAVGFLFIAVTTTFPELFVAVGATLRGAPGLGMGNALGSAVVNLTLVLGLGLLLAGPLRLPREALNDLVEVLFVAGLVVVLLLQARAVGAVHGVVLLAVFAWFVKKAREERGVEPGAAPARGFPRHLGVFLAGTAALLAGSWATVRGAVGLFREAGVAPELLGLTVVALGTSLPELAVCLRCLRRGEPAMALGDILGASTVNLTLVAGAVALLHPVPVDLAGLGGAVPFLLLAVLLLWYLLGAGKPLGRGVAAVLLLAYAAFLLEQLGALGRTP